MTDKAHASYPLVAPTSGDTVLGLQNGLTKRFAVGSLAAGVALADAGGAGLVGFDASESYAAGTVGAKLSEVVSVKDEPFGAVGDGVTDDTAAFQAAIDAVSTAGGGTVHFSARHLIDSNLTIKDGVTLQGPLGLPDELLPANAANYDGMNGVLVVNSAATITTNDSASLCNCIVIRKGLDLPFADAAAATTGVAVFAGTAVTVGGAGSYFHHLLFLGFAKAIYSTNFERIRCEYINGDCTNGIELVAVYDISYIENCHFWPWTTTHRSFADSLLVRAGTAYKFSSVGDWSKFTNCFAYGYAAGFVVNACDNVNLIGCGTDYPTALASTSVGYTISGSSKDTHLIGCQAAAQGTAVQINNTTADGGVTVISGCDFWSNDSYHIDVQDGRAVITGTTFRNGSVGVNIGASCDGVVSTNNDFGNVTTPHTGSGVPLNRSTIFNNRYYNCVDSAIGQRIASDNSYAGVTYTAAASTGGGSLIRARASRGTIAAPTINSDTDVGLTVSAMVHDGSDYGNLGQFRFQAQGAPSAGSTAGSWILSTTPSGATGATDRLAVYRDGNCSPLSDNAYSWGIDGLRWSAIWSANGTIQTSDARTKTDIVDSALGLDFINALRPVSYRFIVGGNEVVRQAYRDEVGNECAPNAEGAKPAEIITNPKPGTRTHWGLIAQEVKAAIPAGVDFAGWVLTDKDDHESQQALRYDQFIAPLIKAVQELSARLDAIERNPA